MEFAGREPRARGGDHNGGWDACRERVAVLSLPSSSPPDDSDIASACRAKNPTSTEPPSTRQGLPRISQAPAIAAPATRGNDGTVLARASCHAAMIAVSNAAAGTAHSSQ